MSLSPRHRAASTIAVLTVLGTGACASTAPHVTLAVAPDASAPYAERAAYYKRAAVDRYDGSRLTLHDGTFVYWPEDLKPAVAPDSHTGQAIDAVVAARAAVQPAKMVSTAGMVVAAGGLLALTGSMVALMGGVVATGGRSPPDGGLVFPLLYGGLGAMGVGGVVAMAPGMVFSQQYQDLADASQKVLTTYPQSLSDRVAIMPDADGRLIDLTESTPLPAEGGLGERGAALPTF